jgi:hypothetical protein
MLFGDVGFVSCTFSAKALLTIVPDNAVYGSCLRLAFLRRLSRFLGRITGIWSSRKLLQFGNVSLEGGEFGSESHYLRVLDGLFFPVVQGLQALVFLVECIE